MDVDDSETEALLVEFMEPRLQSTRVRTGAFVRNHERIAPTNSTDDESLLDIEMDGRENPIRYLDVDRAPEDKVDNLDHPHVTCYICHGRPCKPAVSYALLIWNDQRVVNSFKLACAVNQTRDCISTLSSTNCADMDLARDAIEPPTLSASDTMPAGTLGLLFLLGPQSGPQPRHMGNYSRGLL